LSANNMIKIGDWITMPKYNADGTVIEITLNTVKVQNGDNTISTVPTYSLVTESFSNWRGMQESGVRRIKRYINIDMRSVKFCTDEMISKYKKIEFLKNYIEEKLQENNEYNIKNNIDETVSINGQRLTNLGIFRKYLELYLKNHPMIKKEMTFIVRHLQPTENGIPIEIYVFCADNQWEVYENVQADIFDHILASIREFDLRVFQNPSGEDFGKIIN
jgi:miniconductance mechanosensitive channel